MTKHALVPAHESRASATDGEVLADARAESGANLVRGHATIIANLLRSNGLIRSRSIHDNLSGRSSSIVIMAWRAGATRPGEAVRPPRRGNAMAGVTPLEDGSVSYVPMN